VRGLGADFTAHAERAWDAVADGVPDRAVVVAAHQLLQRLARVTLPVVALAAIGRQYLTGRLQTAGSAIFSKIEIFAAIFGATSILRISGSRRVSMATCW
jgi:enoyl-CoA hydratase/carnithine racemase